MTISIIFEIYKTQLKEFLRQPAGIFWGMLFPIIMSWTLGTIFSKPKTLGEIVIIDNHHFSSLHLQTLKTHPLFSTLSLKLLSKQQAETKVNQGLLFFYLEKDSSHHFQAYFDPNYRPSYETYLHLQDLFRQKKNKTSLLKIKPIKTKQKRYIDFLFAGIITLMVVNSCLWGIGYTLVEKRIKKVLKRMTGTLMSKIDFIVATFLSRFTINLLEFLMFFTFIFLNFQIKIENGFLFIMLFTMGNITFTALAFLVASRTESSHTISGLINAVVIPMMFFSEIFFPLKNFPFWLEKVFHFLPSTLLVHGMRKSIENEASFLTMGPTFFLFTVMSFLFLSLSMKLFKWY